MPLAHSATATRFSSASGGNCTVCVMTTSPCSRGGRWIPDEAPRDGEVLAAAQMACAARIYQNLRMQNWVRLVQIFADFL